MSDELPAKKTSTVPLKKETVRITLRSQSDDSGPVAPKGTTDPIKPKGGTEPLPPTPPAPTLVSAAGPTAPVDIPAPPTVDPMGPTSPVGDASVGSGPVDPLGPTSPVDVAAPVVGTPPPPPVAGTPPPPPVAGTPPPPPAAALPPSGPPSGPLGAKTIPLGPAMGTAAAAGAIGAKTIPLGQMPPAGGQVGKATIPLSGGPTPLPQATVKMGSPTGSLPQPQQATTVRPASDDDELDEVDPDKGMLIFGLAALLLAIGVLVVQLLTYTLNQS